MADLLNAKPADRSDPDTDLVANKQAALGVVQDGSTDEETGQPLYALPDLLNFVSTAEARNQTFMGALQRTSWQRSLKAYRSEHPPQSKYFTEAYKNRTKLFRPKTRMAVRKNLATAAAAFFSNADVVSIAAQFDDDPRRVASAAVIHQLLNYRLSRTTVKSGTPWFLMCMGASMDAQLHGICVSKQYWEYQAVDRERNEPILDPETGEPVLDEDTGEPLTQRVPFKKIIRDRPMVQVVPPENVIIDPAAPWWDPAQGSSYLIVMYPMTIDEARTLLANPGKGNEQWIEVSDEVLRQASQDFSTKGVRLARGGGTDRYDNRSDDQGTDSGITWLYECFFRFRGEDYHFWSVGHRAYASKVRLTEEAYPEQLGERPYAFGYGQIEVHQTYPMSAVESWLQLQNEINEQVNLSTDLLKKRLSPIAKVTQGTMFDWKQLQKRGGPDATIIVRKQDDLTFETTPDNTPFSDVSMAHLNADLDDLSGTTSAGSVSTNRKLNETVGGMRILSAANNAVTEFDLRVFSLTWATVALRQMTRCIQYYESDEVALAIAGQKAKLLERFGIDQLTDADLEHEVTVDVNVGIGAADPYQRMQKLAGGLDMIGKAGPFMKGRVQLKPQRFISEVMGAIGFSDGMSFFEIEEDKPSMAMMQGMLKTKLEEAKQQNAIKIEQMKGARSAESDRLKVIGDLLDTIIKQFGATQSLVMEANLGSERLIQEGMMEALLKALDPSQQGQPQPGGGGEPPPMAPPGGDGAPPMAEPPPAMQRPPVNGMPPDVGAPAPGGLAALQAALQGAPVSG